MSDETIPKAVMMEVLHAKITLNSYRTEEKNLGLYMNIIQLLIVKMMIWMVLMK